MIIIVRDRQDSVFKAMNDQRLIEVAQSVIDQPLQADPNTKIADLLGKDAMAGFKVVNALADAEALVNASRELVVIVLLSSELSGKGIRALEQGSGKIKTVITLRTRTFVDPMVIYNTQDNQLKIEPAKSTHIGVF